jgi:hypothetical protein
MILNRAAVHDGAKNQPCGHHGGEVAHQELIDEIGDVHLEYIQKCRAPAGGDGHIHAEAGEPAQDLR